MLVWLPLVLIGMLLNFQVKRLGQSWTDVAGGTPNYATRLLKRYPLLGRYAAIGYFLGWAGYLPVNAIILAELIQANLQAVGVEFPTLLLKVSLTIIAFIVAFSGTRALAILHGIFAVLAIGLLLLFTAEGFGWLAFAPESPGFFPTNWLTTNAPQNSLTFVDWAKWYFIAVYSACGCETTSSYVADSRKPQQTLRFLSIAAWLIPPIFWGGSWVLMRLATQPDLSSDTLATLAAAALPFWGASTSMLITFLIASSCLLGCATVVSNCPRILYQLARDGYLSPVFGVVSRRGVLGPALIYTLAVSLVALAWGDVVKIVMVTVTSYFVAIMLFHLGLGLNQKNPSVLWARPALAILALEVVVFLVGGIAWGWQDLLLGLFFPIAILGTDVLIRRIPFAPFHVAWWLRRDQPTSQHKIQDFIGLQVMTLVLLVCSTTTIGWFLGKLLNTSNSQDLLLVVIMLIAFVSVAIACWTSLPQIASIAEAREQAEHLFTIASDGIVVVGEEGRIRQVNPAAEQLLGQTAMQLQDQPLANFVTGLTDRPIDWSKRSEQELVHTHQAVELAISDLDHHNFREYVAILRDVTERRNAEKALKRNEEQFRTLVANIPGAVYRCRVDDGWTMEFISDEILTISGYPPSDFIRGQRRNFADIIDPDDRDRVDAIVYEQLQTRQPYILEFRIVCADGSTRWVYEKGQGIFDQEGHILWLDGAIFDMTERKEAEAQLHETLKLQEVLATQATEQAQRLEETLRTLQKTQSQLVQNEKMSSLGRLVAGVAHEINNPVSFIYGNISHVAGYIDDLLNLIKLYQQNYSTPTQSVQELTEAIDLGFLMEDLPKVLNSIRVGASRIKEIVASLRTFSRMDEAEVKSVDIHAGIDSTLMILSSQLKALPNRSEIQIVRNYGDLPLIECFAGQLNQVFMNILSNAADALHDHEQTLRQGALGQQLSYTPTITIDTEVVDEYNIRIRIRDNGPGIREAVRDRLFDPFFTTKPVGQGTGLGLSISYQIVTEKHGGKLTCISQPGLGAELIIEIPTSRNEPNL